MSSCISEICTSSPITPISFPLAELRAMLICASLKWDLVYDLCQNRDSTEDYDKGHTGQIVDDTASVEVVEVVAPVDGAIALLVLPERSSGIEGEISTQFWDFGFIDFPHTWHRSARSWACCTACPSCGSSWPWECGGHSSAWKSICLTRDFLFSQPVGEAVMDGSVPGPACQCGDAGNPGDEGKGGDDLPPHPDKQATLWNSQEFHLLPLVSATGALTHWIINTSWIAVSETECGHFGSYERVSLGCP